MGSTIKDVARETGLAISTISKYLNGGNVRPLNAKRIDEAVQKLHFSPNQNARGLKAARTFRVGLVTGSAHNPHTALILEVIESTLRGMGYSLWYAANELDPETTRQQLAYMLDQGIDGMIIACVDQRAGLGRMAADVGLPVVVLEECFTDICADLIQANCIIGAYDAVEFLIRNGHKKIAILCGDEMRDTARERELGYRRAMQDYGIPIQEKYVVQGLFSFESGYAGTEKLLRMEDRPTALFVSNYDLSVGAVAAINQHDIRIPEELSMVVFDDYELSVFFSPHITSVAQPIREMALDACLLLDKRIRGDMTDFPVRLRIKPELRIRDSVRDLYRWNK